MAARRGDSDGVFVSRAGLQKIIIEDNPFSVSGEDLSSVMVFRNGLLQEAGDDYLIGETEITIIDLHDADEICVWHL